MSSSVTSTSYDSAVDQVLDYLEAQGVDVSSLDLDGVDSSDLDMSDPAIEAYFQLAYMQLMEILYPEQINSLEAQIGEVNFDTLYANTDAETNEIIMSLIEDDPDMLSAMTRASAGDAEGDAVDAYINAIYTPDDGSAVSWESSITDDFEELGLEEWNWVADQEEAFKSAEQSILDSLSEYDQMILDITDAFEAGAITEAQYEQQLTDVNMGREALLGMLQAVQSQEQNFFEMISDLIENMIDTQMAIIRNTGGS